MNHQNENKTKKHKHKGKFKWGIVLLIIGTAMYGVAALSGFLPIDLKLKGILITGIILIGEIINLLAVVLLGKEVVKRYRSYLNPKNWFKNREARKIENYKED